MINKKSEETTVPEMPFPNCQTNILICVDPGSVAQGGRGIYMVDDRVDNGSTMEGSRELQTMCNENDAVSWRIINISNDGTPINIAGFQTEGNGVFGFMKPYPAEGCEDLCWVLEKASSSQGRPDVYQIAILVDNVAYQWNSFIACK